MLTKALVMRPDETHETKEFDLPRDPGYEKLRDIIAPLLGNRACLEHVSVLADPSFSGSMKFKPLDMFVDDCGLLKGLPRNEAATLIYRRANFMGKTAVPPVDDPEKLNFIVGPAILFNRRVWF